MKRCKINTIIDQKLKNQSWHRSTARVFPKYDVKKI